MERHTVTIYVENADANGDALDDAAIDVTVDYSAATCLTFGPDSEEPHGAYVEFFEASSADLPKDKAEDLALDYIAKYADRIIYQIVGN